MKNFTKNDLKLYFSDNNNNNDELKIYLNGLEKNKRKKILNRGFLTLFNSGYNKYELNLSGANAKK